MSTPSPLERERLHAQHGGIPPAIDPNRMRLAVHEAAHGIAVVAAGGQVRSITLGDHDDDGPRTAFAAVPETASASVYYSGPWAEARHLSRQSQPRPEHLREVFDLNNRGPGSDGCALVAAEPGGGSEVIPLLMRCWPAVTTVALEVYRSGQADHRSVCAALGLSDDGGPGSVELAAIRSGLRAVRPRPLNTTRRG